MTYALLYVDGGMWRDPTIYGPFASANAAEDQARARWVSRRILATIRGSVLRGSSATRRS
jgi:hypothetical protein